MTQYGVKCTNFYFTKIFAYDNNFPTEFYHPYIKPEEEKPRVCYLGPSSKIAQILDDFIINFVPSWAQTLISTFKEYFQAAYIKVLSAVTIFSSIFNLTYIIILLIA